MSGFMKPYARPRESGPTEDETRIEVSTPRDAAEAEEIRNRTRSETPAGQLQAVSDMAFRLLEQAMDERKRAVEEAAQRRAEHEAMLAAQRTDAQKEMQLVLAGVREMMTLASDAVAHAYENMQRARQTSEVLNRPPPPRQSGAESAVEFGKHLVTEVAGVVSRLVAQNPNAQERLQALTEQVLGLGSQGGEEALAPSGTAQSQAAAPTPPPLPEAPPLPQAQPALVLGEVIGLLQEVGEEDVQAVAAELGVPGDAVPLSALIPRVRAKKAAQASSEASG